MYIASAQGLEQSLPRWHQAAPLALDTEFIRVDTFFPRLGLVQLGDGQGEALVDPLAIPSLQALAPLLGPSGPCKVLHACSEDLEVLSPLVPQGLGVIHDTQIALAMLGEGLQVGYQKALQLMLGIDIPKDASRSDWLARPLSVQQCDYAALDVRHLPALYSAARERLQARELWPLFVAECAEVCRPVVLPDPELVWLDHPNAWRLPPKALAVLQTLMAWREREAVARDVPRGHLLKPLSLFEMARLQPRTMRELQQIDELNPRVARRDGDALLALIADATSLPPSEWPMPLPMPLPREAGRVFDALKQSLQPVAERLQLPMEVLWRKRLAEQVVLAAVDDGLEAGLAVIPGWRAGHLPDAVAGVLNQHRDALAAWRKQRHAGV